MSKDKLLSGLNQINSTADKIGSVAELAGVDKVTGKVRQAQDKIGKVSNLASAGSGMFNKAQQFSSNMNLSSVTTLAGNVGTVADLLGDEKLAGKAAKLEKGLSQATQGIALAKDVIHRVQRIAPQINQARLSNETMSPLDILTALFKRPPTGLQFTLETGNLNAMTFSVISFEFTARYHDLPYLDVMVSSENPAIAAADVLDNYAKLSIWQDGILQQTYSGMVADFEQGDSGFRLTHYRLKIYPDLWRATLRHNSRIFQQKNIETILTTILAENKVVDYAFVLRHPHPEREFCVQYRETDFEFFQRLTAEEGIFYYFDYHDGQHRLIMTDDVATLKQSVSLPYNLNKNAQLQEKCITTFNRTEQLRPSRVQLKDYTFKKPNWQAQFDSGTGYEHYDFPGRFKDGRGKQYTQYRLDGLRQDAHLGWGESNSSAIQVGKLFTLECHPKSQLNTLWQPIGVTYIGQQPQSSELEAGVKSTTLTCHFDFIPSTQTWRPSQQTKPRVEGPQMAIVTGPKAEEIYTDNFGRIRLQFPWDREGKSDDHSSCWIRVTQPWAGKGWGMMAIPRVGHEVVVNFLDGDPDQPIVTGRAYHANNMSPAGLPANKTQMHIMSQTYKGGGYNGVMMEDSPGAQRLDFQAQKDMTTDVVNNKSTVVTNEHSETVEKAQDITVRGNRNKHVLKAELVSLSKNSVNEVEFASSLTAEKTLIVSSQGGGIALTAGGAFIALDKEGNVNISGSGTVTINGQERIDINNGVVSSDSNAPLTPEEEALKKELQATMDKINKLLDIGTPEAIAAAEALEKAMLAKEYAKLSDAVYDPYKTPPGYIDVSKDMNELDKLGLSPSDLMIKDSNFGAKVYMRDPRIWGTNMSPPYTVAFKGTDMTVLEDWKNNKGQAFSNYSPYYERAVTIGDKIKDSRNSGLVHVTGHSLGGGMASATSVASGANATTYNAAGLHPETVPKYEGKIHPTNIDAYYVKGEILRSAQQEFNPSQLPAASPISDISTIADYKLQETLPDAVGNPYPLEGGFTSLDKHMMKNVNKGVEKSFKEKLEIANKILGE